MRLAMLAFTLFCASGCAIQGAIYSHKTTPLMHDFDSTPVAVGVTSGDVKIIKYYVEVEWGENGIGDIAQQNGIDRIYYADLETIRVLSYWEQNFVRIYGRAKADSGTGDGG